MSGKVYGGFRFDPGHSVAQRTEQFEAVEGSPLAEVIRWLMPLNERVILNKDGSLMACFDFVGKDVDSSDPEDVNQVRSQLVYVMEQLQDLGPTITWQVRRRITTKYPQGVYPDAITSRMNDLQAEKFISDVHYVNRHTLILSLPPAGGSTRLVDAIARAQSRGLFQIGRILLGGLYKSIKGDDDFPYSNMEEVEQALALFEKVVDTFLASTAGLKTRVMTGAVLGGFLQLASTPTSDLDCRAELSIHGTSMLDEVLPQGTINNEYADVLEFQHNTKKIWACSYTLDLRRREKIGMDLLDQLMSAPCEFTLSQVYKALPRNKAAKAVAEAEVYHANRKYSLKSFFAAAVSHGDVSRLQTNEAREKDANEARSLKENIEAGKEGAGYYYGVVMIQAATTAGLETAQKKVEEILQAARLSPRLEGLHKFSSFCATIPGSQEEVARWVKITSENFVDLCPSRTVSDGAYVNEYLSDSIGAPCHALVAFPTKSKTPFYYTGYVGQVGHELVIGGTGTGKTAISTILWSQFRKYPGARVLVFDKNYRFRPAIFLQVGNYLDLNPEKQEGANRKRMSPIAALMKDGSQRHIPFIARWLELLASMRGYTVTSVDRKDLEVALRATAELGQVEPSALRLGTVVVRLDATTALAQQLALWVGDSAYAGYYDNASDDFNIDQLTGIEMGSVLSNEELAAPFMMYAFYRIEVRLRDMGAREDAPIPTQIYIPEAWYFVRQPTFAAELDEWLVTLRKLGARITLDTQNPDKLIQSPVFAAIRDNIPSLILTPNPRAFTASLSRMYTEELGFSEHELNYIARGTPGQDYYIKQGEISRRISMRLSPELVAMVRSDPKAQKALDHYIHLGLPDGWQQKYIQELCHE